MFKLFRFVGKYWKFCLIAPLIMIGEVIADLFQPTLMATIIDQGVANGDIPLILTTGLKMLGISLLGAVCGMGCTILSGIASMGFGTNLRSAIFNKVQTFSFKEIDQFKTSSLITRLTNDITQIQNMLRMGLSMVVRTPFLCIGGIVMSASISPKLSLIFVVAMPLIFGLSSITMKRANPLFKVMQKKIDRVNTVMRENLLGMKVVKAFVGQERERERFGEANEDLMSSSMKAMFTISMMWPIVSLFMGMAIVALFWFGGNLVIVGELESGQIMAFMSYMMQALFSLMSVAMIAMNFSRAEASAQRLNEVLETESSIVDPASPKPYKEISVEFENVFFRYNESDPGYVLKNINFKAEKGETVGIIGGTGSGKSTFISLIPRLYDVTKGAVKIGGIDVRDMSIDDLREHIGVVLQESVLFYGSVEENLRWGDEYATEADLDKAAEAAQAAEFLNNLPEKYDALVEQRGKNFSGGQKQRLSIARTFVKKPDILILDDSMSAVDTATEAKIQKALREREQDGIVFVIAQRVSAIADADKIIVLDDGAISAVGTHKELLKTSEIYRSIAVSQLGEEVLSNVG